MATTTAYCLSADLTDLLSSAGLLQTSDDDASGSLSAGESAYTTRAIAAAGAEIDAALTPWLVTVPPSQSDAALNEWLRQRATYLAAEWLCSRKGQKIPAVIGTRCEMYRADLERVRKGELRVPGLTYPADSYPDEQRKIGKPLVARAR